ncbi:MAG: hypothetical protein WDN75_13805 [Bacteroidota bacterium]
MKRLLIEPFKRLEKANFYTIRFENEGISETDKFISRFDGHNQYRDDLDIIIYWIYKMGNQNGTLERYFRPERQAQAIPLETAGLRLYCIRLSDELVILGNGGIKESRTVQDSPDAWPAFDVMNRLTGKLNRSLRSGETRRRGPLLSGTLEFEI